MLALELLKYSCVSMVLGSLHSVPLMVKNQRRADACLGPISISRMSPFHTTRSTVSSRFLTKSHDCEDKNTEHWHLPWRPHNSREIQDIVQVQVFKYVGTSDIEEDLQRQRSRTITPERQFQQAKSITFDSARELFDIFRFSCQRNEGTTH